MTCRFHGIEPSKKSKEKIQRKVRDEMAAKKAAGSEQPTGSFNQLKHAQVCTLYACCPLGRFECMFGMFTPHCCCQKVCRLKFEHVHGQLSMACNDG